MSCRKAFFHLYTQNAFQLYTQNTFSTVQNAFQLIQRILFQLYRMLFNFALYFFNCIHRILFHLYTECFFNCIHRLPGSFPFYSRFFADQSVATWESRDFPTDCYWLYFEYLPANQLHPAGHVISLLLAIGYTLKISRPTSCTQGVTWFPHCLLLVIISMLNESLWS